MEPGRRIARHLRLRRRRSRARPAAPTTSALASNRSAAPALPRPMASGAVSAAAPARTPEAAMILVLRLVAAIGLAHLEQRHVGKAAVAVALDGRQQARQQARPHRRHLARDRIGELQRVAAAAEVPAPASRGMNDHVMASTMPRPASSAPGAAHAPLASRSARRGRRRGRAASAPTAPCRGRRCARPPRPGRRSRGCPAASSGRSTLTLRPCPRWRSPALRACRGSASRADADAAELLDAGEIEVDDPASASGGAAGDPCLRRRAAGNLQHHGWWRDRGPAG